MTRHNPQRCNVAINKKTSYKCNDELGTYTAEEIDEHDVDLMFGRYMDKPLRHLYIDIARRQYRTMELIKDTESMTIQIIRTKTKVESTQPSLIQKDIREYGKLVVRRSTAKPKDIKKFFQTILKW